MDIIHGGINLEHWESLCPGGLSFVYDDALFRPGTDSFLLGSFPRLKPGARVCDLGSGTGLLGLLLLQRQRELAILFVCHDLALVQSLSHRIMVMYLGVVVESLPSSRLAEDALHPYARALLGSVFSLHDSHEKTIVPLSGEVPSPIDRPAGCPFHTRCPHCTELCRTQMPQMTVVGPEHWVACHQYSHPAQEAP